MKTSILLEYGRVRDSIRDLRQKKIEEMETSGEVGMNNDEIVPGFDEEEDKTVTIRLQRINDRCLVLYFKGVIDFYNSNHVTKQFNKVIEKGFVQLICDMRQVTYISSTGVGSLVSAMKSTKLRNGDLVLIYLQPTPAEVIELLGLSQYFTRAEDLDDAITFFEGKKPKEWPLIFKCPICDKKVKALKAGRYRCYECKTILSINPEFQVALG